MTTAERGRTTGIGSLPHHNVDAALDFAFKMGIPFLPQIPIRNAWEFMISQALEGMPGIQAESHGLVSLNIDIWDSRTRSFQKKLDAAFSAPADDLSAFEDFEPGSASSSCWQPFIWECRERKVSRAKIQLAGPITAQWALRTKEGKPAEHESGVPEQIYKLVLAKALAMTRRMRSEGVSPIFFLDEPGLYGLSSANPRHLLALAELKLVIQTLRKEKVSVGLHCCGDTDWSAILKLGLDWLSLDATVSLESLTSAPHLAALEAYLEQGGRLSLGVVPTARESQEKPPSAALLLERMMESFARSKLPRPAARGIVEKAIFTPACGLALHPVEEAEQILGVLRDFEELLHA